ncbi:MAG: hypothetical protein ACREIT_01355, partial [Tepidisphaeraceae bacterium]
MPAKKPRTKQPYLPIKQHTKDCQDRRFFQVRQINFLRAVAAAELPLPQILEKFRISRSLLARWVRRKRFKKRLGDMRRSGEQIRRTERWLAGQVAFGNIQRVVLASAGLLPPAHMTLKTLLANIATIEANDRLEKREQDHRRRQAGHGG